MYCSLTHVVMSSLCILAFSTIICIILCILMAHEYLDLASFNLRSSCVRAYLIFQDFGELIEIFLYPLCLCLEGKYLYT